MKRIAIFICLSALVGCGSDSTEKGSQSDQEQAEEELVFDPDDLLMTRKWFIVEEKRLRDVRDDEDAQYKIAMKLDKYLEQFKGKTLKLRLKVDEVNDNKLLYSETDPYVSYKFDSKEFQIGEDISESFARTLKKDDEFYAQGTIDVIYFGRIEVSNITAIEERAEGQLPRPIYCLHNGSKTLAFRRPL